MKTILNKYFDFNRGELNGLLILVLLIVCITALPSFYRLFKTEIPFDKKGRAAMARLILTEDRPEKYSAVNSDKSAKAPKFIFDPNTLNMEGWQKIGLTSRQAQAIINYRNKGGRFFKPQDLQKMYTIKPALYKELLPYINIETQSLPAFEKVFNKDKQYKKVIPIIVDINSADTLQLDKVNGIGAAFARRIVKYRERLGGFYKTEQLKEVYGLDSLKYSVIKDQVKIGAGIRKININSATFDELKDHPYLRFKQINAIIQYRKLHGSFPDAASLKKVVLLDGETIGKLTPYLIF